MLAGMLLPVAALGETNEPIAIQFWNGWSGSDGDVLIEMVDRFNETNPYNLTIEMDINSEFPNKIAAEFAADSGPQLILGANNFKDLYVGYLLPLNEIFAISTLDMGMTFNNAVFAGLDNFREALGDWRFWNSLVVTLKWTAVEVPLQLITAIAMAGLLRKNSRPNQLFRAIYFMPVICSATATGIMWKRILHSNVGYIPYIMKLMGLGKVNFMNNPSVTFYVIVFMSVWKTFGVSMTIFIGAMQNVSADLYEAADLDGCGKLRQFFQITLPCIRPTLWFLMMTRIIGSFQVFDIVYTTTGGGPNYTTETLVSYIYSRGFGDVKRMGYASSLSIWLLALILIRPADHGALGAAVRHGRLCFCPL